MACGPGVCLLGSRSRTLYHFEQVIEPPGESCAVSIQIRCDGCGSVLRVAEKHLGKKTRCPKCNGTVNLVAPGTGKTEAGQTAKSGAVATPKSAAGPTSPSTRADRASTPTPKAEPAGRTDGPKAPKLTANAILAGIQGEFPSTQVSLMYRLGIFISAVIMILLPLVYMGLICLVCQLVYYHAVNDITMLEGARGRGAVYVLGAYVAPMIVGAILVFFMLKPLCARSAKPAATRSLTPEERSAVVRVRSAALRGDPCPGSQADRYRQPGERLGVVPTGLVERSGRKRPGSHDWRTARGRPDRTATGRRAGARVRTFFARHRDAAELRRPVHQRLVCTGRLRARSVGRQPGAGGAFGRYPPRHLPAPSAADDLADAPRPVRPDVGRPRRVLLHVAPDGIRCRPV